VAHVANFQFALGVNGSHPAKSMKELIAWYKANPAKANFGSPAPGSLPHFFALMLNEKTGVQAPVIGYRGSASVLTDLVGGHVPVAVDTLDTLEPQHAAGKIRMLAVSGEKRSTASPDVPTFREIGIDLTATGWNTLFAPASMPAAKVRRLSAAVSETMRDPALRAKFTAAKMEPVSATTEETAAGLKAYRAQWEPVVKGSGYRP
ncbi:MAG: tripartite tricarboxylate transporter substrate-binding protein, partial [Gammaproteobacteria bacterium]